MSSQNTDWERKYQLAVLAAQYGDYSGLRALGIDTSAMELTGGYSGGGSRGSSSGGGTSDYQTVDSWLRSKLMQGYSSSTINSAIDALAGDGSITKSQAKSLKNRYGVSSGGSVSRTSGKTISAIGARG